MAPAPPPLGDGDSATSTGKDAGTDGVMPPRGGLRPAAVLGLAALGLPRVVFHDLGIVGEGDPVTPVLVLGPLIAWITRRRDDAVA